ncbi:MAG: hypothetical protein R3Y43_07480 [Alphaproteobacteria bacterium]
MKEYYIVVSENKEWGFYGTVHKTLKSEEETNKVWMTASTVIRDVADNIDAEDVMHLLDSKWGRHLADSFYNEIKDGTFEKKFRNKTSKRELIQAYIDYVNLKPYKLPRLSNSERFCHELALLSRKYGVVIQSIGGVYLGTDGFIKYNTDLKNGDLIPIWDNKHIN